MRVKKKGGLGRILRAIAIVVAVLVVLVGLALWILSRMPAVQKGYWEKVTPGGTLEQRYTGLGPWAVTSFRADSGDEKTGQYFVCYPSEGEGDWPVVIMANGTGVPASKYEAVFAHLASWGFIVAGNEDASSWDGVSSAATLDFILAANRDVASPLYQRVNTGQIGIAGHSQGGVGAVNGATRFENSGYYRSVYLASATWSELAVALGWDYDISGLSAACFMTAGTGEADAETIAPLEALNQSFEAVDCGGPVVLARRRDTDHGEMLANADGYMTAWFCWTLKGDSDAAGVFSGPAPELADNPDNWQDVRIKGMAD